MAFVRSGAKTPTGIGPIHITLHDPNGINNERSAEADVTILDQDGEVLGYWRGDLLPHLSPAQVTSVVAFLDAMRTKAVAEILPTI